MEHLFDLHHPAAGAYFYGREQELAFFEKNLFEPAAGGASRYYSLTGMNRIGKSSLVPPVSADGQPQCNRYRNKPRTGGRLLALLDLLRVEAVVLAAGF